MTRRWRRRCSFGGGGGRCGCGGIHVTVGDVVVSLNFAHPHMFGLNNELSVINKELGPPLVFCKKTRGGGGDVLSVAECAAAAARGLVVHAEFTEPWCEP
jgi:hypothetical protein